MEPKVEPKNQNPEVKGLSTRAEDQDLTNADNRTPGKTKQQGLDSPLEIPQDVATNQDLKNVTDRIQKLYSEALSLRNSATNPESHKQQVSAMFSDIERLHNLAKDYITKLPSDRTPR